MTRHLIVVDIETTGLVNPVPLEIAAINVDTGEEFYMVLQVTGTQLAAAEPIALKINRYYERGVYEDMLNAEETKGGYGWLSEMLTGNTFAGSNPTFDSAILRKALGDQVWHHRLADLAAYTAGILGLDPTELPGLADVCAKCYVTNDEPHGAMSDARATAACFRQLRDWAVRNRAS